MPRPRKYAKKKRPYRRRRKTNYKLGLNKNPFPVVYYAKVTYADQIELAPQNGLKALYRFYANQLYDIDKTSIGHQAMGTDEIYAMGYRKYKVLGSRISLVMNQDYSTQQSYSGNFITITLREDDSTSGSWTEIAERPNISYTATNRTKISRLSKNFSAKRFFQVSNVKDADELEGNLGNTGIGSLAPKSAYYNISAFPVNAGSASYPTFCNVKITYIAMFYGRVPISGS